MGSARRLHKHVIKHLNSQNNLTNFNEKFEHLFDKLSNLTNEAYGIWFFQLELREQWKLRNSPYSLNNKEVRFFIWTIYYKLYFTK